MKSLETKKVSGDDMKNWLLSHQTRLEYSKQYLDGQLHMIKISILLEEGLEVGFIDSKIIHNVDLSSHDDAEWIVSALKEGQTYYYIETLNICSEFHRRGYGTKIVEQLKKTVSEPILVYTTADSFDFWYQQGFRGVEGDEYWMTYENEIKCEAIG